MRFLLLGILTLNFLFWTATVQSAEPKPAAVPATKDAAEISPKDLAFFEEHVRPLLIKRCYSCHSADAEELKGGLALDTRAAWQTGGDSGPALEPGKPDESLLIDAVRFEVLEMPPSGKLPAEEIAILEKWVKLGAPDPRAGDAPQPVTPVVRDLAAAREFWAFQLPEPHGAPEVQNKAWPQDEIDYFVLAKLEANQLSPAIDAEKATWLRRLSFDLIGLPPTPSEMRDFLADTAADAKEKVVDRLLASPQFGAHWGRHWLDVARYADSNGSDFNATFFNAWRYRNYVVDAFNQDQPFDQFIREQIAGDLLPAGTESDRVRQLIGSTFLTLGPKMLSERDKEKLTMDVVDEQIDTVGKAFLGLTLGCARCHDHKFDPISTKEYYALAGIFNSTVTLEGESQQYVSTWVETPLPVPAEFTAEMDAYNKVKATLQSKLTTAETEHKRLTAELAKHSLGDEGILVDDVDAKVVGNWVKSKFSPNHVGKGYLHDEKQGKGEKSVTWTPNLPHAGQYEVRIAFAGSSGRDTAVPVTISHAKGETQIKLDQSQLPPIRKTFSSLGTFEFKTGDAGFVTLSNAGTTGYVIADAVQFIPQQKSADLVANEANNQPGAPPEPTEADLVAVLKTSTAKAAESIKTLTDEMKKLAKDAPKPPSVMAPREAPEIADCQVCIRGEVQQRGESVPRGFLAVVSDSQTLVKKKDESGRRELADWIARADHPLTSRVIVNRIWQHMLGEGLVKTVDNFGHLGQRPSHPELLDTLAVQFVERGWSTKTLIRQIALSHTYGMSTELNEEAAVSDPDNRLLWRANRKFLPAEALRDAMLQFTGQLDYSQGESPVSEMGRLAVDNNNQQNIGSKTVSLRRSLYAPIVRNQIPSYLTLFDFADPDLVTGRRPTTNVPAQALYLINSPFVKQQAETIAKEMLAEKDSDEERLEAVFQLILNRPPSTAEQTQTVKFIADVMGEEDEQRPQAWSQVIQSLMASTEFRTLD